MLLSHKSGTKVTLFLIYNKFICLFIQSFYYPPIVFRFLGSRAILSLQKRADLRATASVFV